MSTYTKNLNLFKYDTSTDSNVAFSITKALNNNWDIIDSKCGSSNNILDFKWSDHILNDQSWLRADTFSWQSGTTYSQAYNELLSEYNNSASTTKKDGSITYKRTPKGYKIALSNQETAILNKYNSDGIAWYYILDTANKKFKLPRTKWGFKSVRSNVGDDIAESLPNIKGELRYATDNDGKFISNSLFKLSNSTYPNVQTMYGNSNNQRTPYFDASLSSSTYQNGAPVQERATQMYLYFYVGAFTKSAEAQTAGLKAELLNGKQDVCIHIIDTYVNGTSGYRLWSDGFKEQWGQISSSNVTVTLLQKFSNTNFNVQITTTYTSAQNWHLCYENKANRKTSSINIICQSTSNFGSNWYACGY